MANTKNALLRTMIIDRCLSDHRRNYSTQDMMDECNKALSAKDMAEVTSLNTIRDDIAAIEEQWMVEIETVVSGRNKYYRYAKPGFSIYNTCTTPAHQDMFCKAMNLLKQIGTELFDYEEKE